MLLGDDRDLGLEPVALGHRVAGLGVRPLALRGQIGATLRGLGAAGRRLLLLEPEIPLEVHDALDVAAEGVDPLGHRGELDATSGEPVGQPGLVPLPGLEQRLQRGHVAAQAGLLLGGGHQGALQLEQLRGRLVALARELLALGREGLQVAGDPV